MDILLKQCTVYDSSSPFHLKKADLLIRDGVIQSIDSQLQSKADKLIELEGLCVSAGWVDVFSQFADPGFEYRETLETGADSAIAGGYTDVFVVPNTAPTLHSKTSIEYVCQKSKSLPITVHPIGAVTKNIEGKELAEMYDMTASGAVAFSDGWRPLQSAGVWLKALQYLKAAGKILIQIPDEHSINPHGLMNEGILSTQLGLPGVPVMAEEMMVSRGIELARYSKGQLHFTGISCAGAVALIKKAKDEGLAVTCSVTPYHLFFTEDDLQDYDTNLKLTPPLRSAEDRDALRTAVLEGTIDCIASHHLPHHTDHKIVEFETAQPGMIGLQTAFGAVRSSLSELDPERLVALFAENPRKIFGLPQIAIKEGTAASLTIFSMEKQWVPDKNTNKSRSQNSAFFGKTLRGKALGIINKGHVILHEI